VALTAQLIPFHGPVQVAHPAVGFLPLGRAPRSAPETDRPVHLVRTRPDIRAPGVLGINESHNVGIGELDPGHLREHPVETGNKHRQPREEMWPRSP
jgi:hypothetical protein